MSIIHHPPPHSVLSFKGSRANRSSFTLRPCLDGGRAVVGGGGGWWRVETQAHQSHRLQINLNFHYLHQVQPRDFAGACISPFRGRMSQRKMTPAAYVYTQSNTGSTVDI